MQLTDSQKIIVRQFFTFFVLFYLISFPVEFVFDMVLGTDTGFDLIVTAKRNVIPSVLFGAVMTFLFKNTKKEQ